MRSIYDERTIKFADYIAENGATVRETAKHFCISKSTVHKDISLRLCKIDKDMDEKVRQVLERNKSERHIRGGQATKKKYIELKKKCLHK